MELALNYARKFGDHNVTALLLYNQSKKYYPSEYSDIPTGYVGLVGRVTYDWKTRYMAEFNAGYNGSENFAKGKRFGFFPSIALGWLVSEEQFMEPIRNVISKLKLRASVGTVGNDNIGGRRSPISQPSIQKLMVTIGDIQEILIVTVCRKEKSV